MLGRKYGLASDQIVSLNIVNADGNIITADAHNNSDLLFASQGPDTSSIWTISWVAVYTTANHQTKA